MGRNKSKDNSIAKFLLILGGILGLFSVLGYFIENSIGAWWQVDVQLGFIGTSYYLNAFGMASENATLVLEYLGLFAGILFILASIFTFLGVSKESKSFSFMSLVLMIACLYLFCYALLNVQEYGAIIDLLNFLSSSTEYNIYFGNIDLGLFGNWTWRLGNGFFIACAAGICTLIGAIKI